MKNEAFEIAHIQQSLPKQMSCMQNHGNGGQMLRHVFKKLS